MIVQSKAFTTENAKDAEEKQGKGFDLYKKTIRNGEGSP